MKLNMGTHQESSIKLPRNGRRVILFPLPFQGHINPMLQLASILYSKGFSITIIHTNIKSPDSRNYPHFEFHSISTGLSETEASNEDTSSFIMALNVNCIIPFRNCLANLMSNVEEKDSFACLIVDSLWYFTHGVANDFKLRTMVLQTYSFSTFLALAAYPFLKEKGYLPIQDSQLEAPVIELPPLRVKDIPIFQTKNPQIVDKVMLAMDNEIKASSGIIWNSFHDLEQTELTKLPQQLISIPNFPIGPFHKYFPASSSGLLSQDQSSISWLDKQKPKSVIYISFGSIATVDETEFLEIAWGLANSGVPFLWVVRPGLVRKTEWLEPLPKGFMEMIHGKGHIVKWAPQQEVLAHPSVGGFWTHNGWNSTLESICEGVPMICQPCLGDQMLNARYVSDVWGIGLHLEGKVERREIERAIRRVMMESESQKMRERVMYLKEKVDASLREGGSSYQSLESLIDLILSF